MSSTIPSPTPTAVALASVDDMRVRIRQKRQLKGRQVDAASAAEVRALIGEPTEAGYRRDLLIEYLHRLNDAWRGLHERHLVALAAALKIGMAEVYEVATFYHHFEVLGADAKAPGLTVRVCSGLSCALGGGAELLHTLKAALDTDAVRVIPAPCLGRCEQGPMVVVHQNPVPHADARKVMDAVQAQALQHPAAQDTGSFDLVAQVERSITSGGLGDAVAPAYVGLQAYQAQGGYTLLADLVADRHEAEHIMHVMENSGLRGLGGAGFPAGRKWRIVRRMDGPRMMAINIDEGEPGTFKDRTYLERDPHRFLEGMLVAARVVGVQSCYIYLRDEYHGCRAILETELDKLRAAALFPLPHIELRRGAGAYICGEESAMIESIEGKRGEPRKRPPYIASVGLFGHPTLEHNFETLYWVRDILEKGAEWFAGFGRNGRKGLRSYSVSGRVRAPGVKLAPAGISVRELIDEYCGGMLDGHDLHAYLPGGASGGILPARLAGEPLDFDTLQPHGCFIGSAAVIVLSQHDSARDAALNMMHFFADESCGQCTPCRVGTVKAAQLMQAPVWDNETLEDLAQVMTDASICGLGQAAPNPIRSVQRYFAQEIR